MSLTDVANEGLSLVAPLAAHRGIRAVSELPDSPPLGALADRQRLGQVLLNLLSNAVKYNRDGGEVRVDAARFGERVRLRVRDTGCGIAPDKIGRLFTPFDRLGAESTGVEGTGLGLALSKRLVEAMGGYLGVESTPGEGSAFWIDLPAADAPPAPLAEAVGDDGFALPPCGPPHQVLYVEDNPANLRLIELALAHRPGVGFMAAMQGGIGLELARRHRPDLILLDVHLPDMTGAEVLGHLRADPQTRDIPVVVLSADATPVQIARLLKAGAADYLTKPLDIRQFLRVLDDALQPDPELVGATRHEAEA